MLSTLKVSNFKAFAEGQSIPLSPITLIFGPNSAGKSSILHSLLLYHHAAQTGNVDVRRTRLGGETVDLGGFERYVHGRNRDSTVSFRIESELQSASVPETKDLNSEAGQRMLKMLLDQGGEIGLVLEVEREHEEGEAGTYSITTPPHIKSFEIEVDGELVLRADRKGDSDYSISRLIVGNSSISSVLESVASDVEHSEQWEEEKRWLNSQVQFEAGNLGPSVNSTPRFRREQDRVQQQKWRVAAAQNESNYGRGISSETGFANQILLELAQVVCQVAAKHFQEEAGCFQYLAPLRSYPSRRLLRQETERPGEDWRASGGYAWELLRDDSEVREKVNEWLGDDFLQTNYRVEVDQHYSSRELGSQLPGYLVDLLVSVLADHFLDRSEIESGEPSGLNQEFIGATAGLSTLSPLLGALGTGAAIGIDAAQNTGEEDMPELVQELAGAQSTEEIRQTVVSVLESEEIVGSWIQRLENDADPDMPPDLALVDEKGGQDGTRVSHRDIGIGISQVLPVLVYAQAVEESTVLMEQPELHLHPRLQTRLGDIFIDSMREKGNQFIIETHSEHLILRLLRRIRETNQERLPESRNEFERSDLSVIFVDPEYPAGSFVEELKVDSEGNLVDGWPGSFFDEEFHERFS